MKLPSHEGYVQNFGFRYRLDATLHVSQIVAFATPLEGSVDLYSLKNFVEGDLRSTIDLIGFGHGYSFDVELIAAANMASRESIVFGIDIPVLATARSKEEGTFELRAELLIAVGARPAAQMILACLREAMRMPAETGLLCYRAIEGMMHDLAQDRALQNKDAAWSWFRTRINVARESLDWLKHEHADDARHGRPTAIGDDDRARVFSLTWEIARRYFAIISEPSAGLPDFALLYIGNDGQVTTGKSAN
jgi:hypothetical protein